MAEAMSTERFIGAVLLPVSDALGPLQGATASPDELAKLLADLGFELDPAARSIAPVTWEPTSPPA